jgi:hypothetical protein
MPVEILRLSEAARRLELTTLEVVRLVTRRQVEYVLVDGVPRISDAVVERMLRERPAS